MSKKVYESPEWNEKLIDCEDIVTASNDDISKGDNNGGYPTSL